MDHQDEFLYSDAPSTGLVAGFGSGKSYIAALKAVTKMHRQQCHIGYYLPTYQLIKDVAFENFVSVLEDYELKYKLNESDKTFYTPWGNIFMRSLDNPQSIIGYQTGYAVIDEADVLPMDKMKKAYGAVVARNRIPVKGPNCTDMVSTPEGFKFLYDFYVKNGNERRKLIHANTLDNPFLSESYIENLRDTYPAEMLEAYMKGQFVNLTTGNVYRAFDRKKHCDTSKEAGNNILYVGMDFNITNMAATISIKEGDIRYVVEEITGAYDTADMIGKIRERHPGNRIIVYPDSAGSARNTSGMSDHQMLKLAGFKVVAPPKNPPVRDRINAVNNELEKGRLFINPNTCPSLLDALEKQGYNKHGEPDKQSGMDHVADALGYEIHNSQGARVSFRRSSVF